MNMRDLHEIEFSIAINSDGVCYITQQADPATALSELGDVEGLGSAVRVYNIKLRVPGIMAQTPPCPWAWSAHRER